MAECQGSRGPAQASGGRRVAAHPVDQQAVEGVGESVRVRARPQPREGPVRGREEEEPPGSRRGRSAARPARAPRGRGRARAPRSGGARPRTARAARRPGSATPARRPWRARSVPATTRRWPWSASRIFSVGGSSSGIESSAPWKASAPCRIVSKRILLALDVRVERRFWTPIASARAPDGRAVVALLGEEAGRLARKLLATGHGRLLS